MNLHKGKRPVPLRVLFVNPLAPASQMTAMKILDGSIFGAHQMIDLTLLVYINEVDAAEALKMAMDACAYSNTNSINVSTQLPNIVDADVFCFITNFKNPNSIDYNQTETDAHFDTLYLLLKLAHNFSLRPPAPSPAPPAAKPAEDDTKKSIKKRGEEEPKLMRPIFITDGLIALDILNSFSKYIPADVLYCPTSLAVIAKTVLGEYLKVNCDVINDVLVWAANDSTFFVDVQEPCLKYDHVPDVTVSRSRCAWPAMSDELQHEINLDHTQFNSKWMRSDYINEIAEVASRHPYGAISKASEFSKTLKEIWKQRTNSKDKHSYANFGVISDGSLGSIKGCPYIMPVCFKGDTWVADTRQLTRYTETYLQYEIKRMNKAVKEHHSKLMTHCKEFLSENVINEAFIPSDEVSSSFTVQAETVEPTSFILSGRTSDS